MDEYLGVGEKRPGKYVIPHRLCQDVLENFFGLIRSSGGNDRHRDMSRTLTTVQHLHASRARAEKRWVKKGNCGDGCPVRKRAAGNRVQRKKESRGKMVAKLAPLEEGSLVNDFGQSVAA